MSFSQVRAIVAAVRLFLPLLVLLCSLAIAEAGRNKLKPTDFEPLTELPWKKPGATLESVLDKIFREPNETIRYPILAEYLRAIPERDLGKAFDICVRLEGAQVPDKIVAFLLQIWGERDPVGGWEKTKKLFRVVGIGDDWLLYDSWQANDRPKITVQDREAIKASPYWLSSSALTAFPAGVELSSAPKAQQLKIMKEFAAKWFESFGPQWPGWHAPSNYPDRFDPSVFAVSTEFPPGAYLQGDYPRGQAYSEILQRRWLLATPQLAPEIVKFAHATKWPPADGQMEPVPAGPSTEFFMLWAKIDLPGMVRWAESLDQWNDEMAGTAKGFLMSRVDAETRQRWLVESQFMEAWTAFKSFVSPANGIPGGSSSLFEDWAKWDPNAALDAAAKIGNADTVNEAIAGATWNFFTPYNMRHCGLGAVKEFPFFQLREEVQTELATNWSQFVMEEWGEIDIGETARYGLDFMLRIHYAPRENLIQFFSGYDVYPDEGGMIDRTFCALRVWAVFKPGEMKAWIATLDDADMRKALTWLLEHPWGGKGAKPRTK